MFEKRVTPYSTASNCCELVCLWACPQKNDLTHCRPYMQDISMWIPEEFVDNDLFEMIRDEGGDQVRDVWVGVDVWAVNGWGRLGIQVTFPSMLVTQKHLAGGNAWPHGLTMEA